jgi:predicted transcriptional regulator
MTKDQINAVLERVRSWPEERQEELVAIALEIEAGIAGTPYRATAEELEAIDQGLADAESGRFATEDQVAAIFAKYRDR